MTKGLESNYRSLIASIILQAANDLFTCERAIEKGKSSANKIPNVKLMKQECLNFFNGTEFENYMDMLSPSLSISGNNAIMYIQQAVANKQRYPKDYMPWRYEDKNFAIN